MIFSQSPLLRHGVEHVGKVLEKFQVVPSLHIVEETVHLVDARTLVVTGGKRNSLVHDLVAVKQDDCFYAVLPRSTKP